MICTNQIELIFENMVAPCSEDENLVYGGWGSDLVW